MPVQGGFLLVRPDLEVYEALRAIVREVRETFVRKGFLHFFFFSAPHVGAAVRVGVLFQCAHARRCVVEVALDQEDVTCAAVLPLN